MVCLMPNNEEYPYTDTRVFHISISFMFLTYIDKRNGLPMSETYPPIRIIIADDHPLFIEGFVNVINKKAAGKIDVVAQVNNGKELILEVERKRPDVVVTDIQMPVMDGVEASRIINEKYSSIGVIAFTMYSDSELIYRMFETGAKGYLTKYTHYSEVIEAIETVSRGQMHYCSEVLSSLIKTIGSNKFDEFKKNNSKRFCKNEVRIMQFICQQLTTKEIAGTMKISPRTVEEYSRKIKEKIEAKNMVGIALYAVKNGIVSVNEI